MTQLPEKKLTRDEVEAAAKVLFLQGVLDVLSTGIINGAYRFKLREHHPDIGGPVVDAATRIAELQGARQTLLRWLAEQPDPNCVCCGTGFVASGSFNSRPCPRCGEK